MKKLVTLVCMLAILAAALLGAAGCGGRQYTIQSGKLMVGLELDPPWLIQKGSGYEGFGADVLKQVADRLKLTVVYVPGASRQTRAADLNAKKYDVDGAPAGIIPNNEKVVDLTIPVATTARSVIVLKSSTALDMAALKGKVIGALDNTPDVTDAQAVSGTGAKAITDENALLAALDNGSVDAAVMASSEYHYADTGTNKYREVGKLTGTLDWAFAVRKGNTNLLDQLNNVLNAMKEDGTLRQIQLKWQVTT